METRIMSFKLTKGTFYKIVKLFLDSVIILNMIPTSSAAPVAALVNTSMVSLKNKSLIIENISNLTQKETTTTTASSGDRVVLQDYNNNNHYFGHVAVPKTVHALTGSDVTLSCYIPQSQMFESQQNGSYSNVTWMLPSGITVAAEPSRNLPNLYDEHGKKNSSEHLISKDVKDVNISDTSKKKVDQDKRRVQMNYIIKNTKLTDSGRYTCRGGNDDFLASFQVIVVAPPRAPHQCHVIEEDYLHEIRISCASDRVDPESIRFRLVAVPAAPAAVISETTHDEDSRNVTGFTLAEAAEPHFLLNRSLFFSQPLTPLSSAKTATMQGFLGTCHEEDFPQTWDGNQVKDVCLRLSVCSVHKILQSAKSCSPQFMVDTASLQDYDEDTTESVMSAVLIPVIITLAVTGVIVAGLVALWVWRKRGMQSLDSQEERTWISRRKGSPAVPTSGYDNPAGPQEHRDNLDSSVDDSSLTRETYTKTSRSTPSLYGANEDTRMEKATMSGRPTCKTSTESFGQEHLKLDSKQEDNISRVGGANTDYKTPPALNRRVHSKEKDGRKNRIEMDAMTSSAEYITPPRCRVNNQTDAKGVEVKVDSNPSSSKLSDLENQKTLRLNPLTTHDELMMNAPKKKRLPSCEFRTSIFVPEILTEELLPYDEYNDNETFDERNMAEGILSGGTEVQVSADVEKMKTVKDGKPHVFRRRGGYLSMSADFDRSRAFSINQTNTCNNVANPKGQRSYSSSAAEESFSRSRRGTITLEHSPVVRCNDRHPLLGHRALLREVKKDLFKSQDGDIIPDSHVSVKASNEDKDKPTFEREIDHFKVTASFNRGKLDFHCKEMPIVNKCKLTDGDYDRVPIPGIEEEFTKRDYNKYKEQTTCVREPKARQRIETKLKENPEYENIQSQKNEHFYRNLLTKSSFTKTQPRNGSSTIIPHEDVKSNIEDKERQRLNDISSTNNGEKAFAKTDFDGQPKSSPYSRISLNSSHHPPHFPNFNVCSKHFRRTHHDLSASLGSLQFIHHHRPGFPKSCFSSSFDLSDLYAETDDAQDTSPLSRIAIVPPDLDVPPKLRQKTQPPNDLVKTIVAERQKNEKMSDYDFPKRLERAGSGSPVKEVNELVKGANLHDKKSKAEEGRPVQTLHNNIQKSTKTGTEWLHERQGFPADTGPSPKQRQRSTKLTEDPTISPRASETKGKSTQVKRSPQPQSTLITFPERVNSSTKVTHVEAKKKQIPKKYENTGTLVRPARVDPLAVPNRPLDLYEKAGERVEKHLHVKEKPSEEKSGSDKSSSKTGVIDINRGKMKGIKNYDKPAMLQRVPSLLDEYPFRKNQSLHAEVHDSFTSADRGTETRDKNVSLLAKEEDLTSLEHTLPPNLSPQMINTQDKNIKESSVGPAVADPIPTYERPDFSCNSTNNTWKDIYSESNKKRIQSFLSSPTQSLQPIRIEATKLSTRNNPKEDSETAENNRGHGKEEHKGSNTETDRISYSAPNMREGEQKQIPQTKNTNCFRTDAGTYPGDTKARESTETKGTNSNDYVALRSLNNIEKSTPYQGKYIKRNSPSLKRAKRLASQGDLNKYNNKHPLRSFSSDNLSGNKAEKLHDVKSLAASKTSATISQSVDDIKQLLPPSLPKNVDNMPKSMKSQKISPSSEKILPVEGSFTASDQRSSSETTSFSRNSLHSSLPSRRTQFSRTFDPRRYSMSVFDKPGSEARRSRNKRYDMFSRYWRKGELLRPRVSGDFCAGPMFSPLNTTRTQSISTKDKSIINFQPSPQIPTESDV